MPSPRADIYPHIHHRHNHTTTIPTVRAQGQPWPGRQTATQRPGTHLINMAAITTAGSQKERERERERERESLVALATFTRWVDAWRDSVKCFEVYSVVSSGAFVPVMQRLESTSCGRRNEEGFADTGSEERNLGHLALGHSRLALQAALKFAWHGVGDAWLESSACTSLRAARAKRLHDGSSWTIVHS
jgi:LmbE family N-acetylglucosaminyl deacetylase